MSLVSGGKRAERLGLAWWLLLFGECCCWATLPRFGELGTTFWRMWLRSERGYGALAARSVSEGVSMAGRGRVCKRLGTQTLGVFFLVNRLVALWEEVDRWFVRRRKRLLTAENAEGRRGSGGCGAGWDGPRLAALECPRGKVKGWRFETRGMRVTNHRWRLAPAYGRWLAPSAYSSVRLVASTIRLLACVFVFGDSALSSLRSTLPGGE